jgi:hypothetical protein
VLPNGDVVVLNGGQSGVAGYPVSFNNLPEKPRFSQSDFPAFWAFLYQPDAPRGEVRCGRVLNDEWFIYWALQLPRCSKCQSFSK